MLNITSNPALKLALGVAAVTIAFTTDGVPAIQTTVSASANGNSMTVPSTSGMATGDFLATETGNSAGTGPWVTTIIGVSSATVLSLAQPAVRSTVTNAVLSRFERIETRYRAKKVTLTNLTNGDVHVWDTTLKDNQAYKTSGGTTTTVTAGILNRSNCIGIHPNLLPVNCSFTLQCEYDYHG
jgi:hypothetical protein